MRDMLVEDLYVDALCNLQSGARLMLVDLRLIADAVSDRELAGAIYDYLAQVNHRLQRLTTMLARFSVPARVHAEELESLTNHAVRYMASWASGDVHDIAAGTVCRAAAHYMIPQYQLACVLARSLGYTKQAADLEAMLETLLAADEAMRQHGENRVKAHFAHTGFGLGSHHGDTRAVTGDR